MDDVYWEWAGLATGEWRRARQCLLGVGESAEAGQYLQRGKAIYTYLVPEGLG